ncbi:MAG TPA: hypothetical protein VN676_06830 [Steroidobacteraceae bacterium]|nr:hypothetical protein [Steroidobacteraceae bacterium]
MRQGKGEEESEEGGPQGEQVTMRMRLTVRFAHPLLGAMAIAATTCFGLSCLAVPARAGSVEAKPFGIKGFTMQTVDRTEERPVVKGGFVGVEFSNKPYLFTQAGGHPWALTTTGEFTSEETAAGATIPTRDPKDIVTILPPGLLGDPQATPRCPLALLTTHSPTQGLPCPSSTQVGTYAIEFEGGNAFMGPIINVTPAAGESAEFALENESGGLNEPLLTAHLVHSAQGAYGFTVVSNEVPMVNLVRFEVTFWGVPADPSHDSLRGRFCTSQRPRPLECEVGVGNEPAGVAPVPFLSMGTNCAAGPETATLRADSWEEPGSVREGHYSGYSEASTTLPAVTGCNLLSFPTSLALQPDTQLADAPVGVGVNVSVPQNEQPSGRATPHLRDAVVTLPPGMSISPGIVDGIQACDENGPEGINFEGPESEEVGLLGELQLAPGHCPNASTVGTAEAITPLLPQPVKGHVYLARPSCGGAAQAACTTQDALDGRLYQLYLELGGTGELGDAGINIKAHGYVEANPATGQLTTKFLENPQTPFSELKIHLNGGPRAPLDNPSTCGLATTTADFTPWSEPGLTPEGLQVAGTPDSTPSSFFDVEGCANPPRLSPGFTSGTVSPQAGAFSTFTVNLTRGDREQFIKGVQVHTPPGLLGMLSSVPLCGGADAQSGHCPESSKIGTTRVASGAGSHPFEIGGSVYLTTGYGGAPFGLSIVTDAVAGPFNLGLVVVRARIAVDPVNSSLTITTNETGPYAIPQILFGVPLRLKQVTVDIDRPNFMFNPTNCEAQRVTANVAGSENALAPVSSPFAAAGCKSLEFKPTFAVSTSGKTSKALGASLDASVTYPPFKAGSEANISYVKVELPKQLPSRLTTLQKACLAAVFAANPANCPPESVIGVVRATTPVLPVPLNGPVYFVSHGGEAFPSLVAVLQGDGVRVDLTGTTFISKAGITSSTFKTVPDVPVRSFELYLPEGPFSALTANRNLCALTTTSTQRHKVTVRGNGHVTHKTVSVKITKPASLAMPTELIAQNGAVLKSTTAIRVTGCTKAKPKARATKRLARPAIKAHRTEAR